MVRGYCLLAAAIIALGGATKAGAAVTQVNYFTDVSGTLVIDFESPLAGGAFPGTNYNGDLGLSGASFGERFAGQTNSPNSDNFDVLSGSPSSPLSLAFGPAGQNLVVYFDAQNTSSQILSGLGPVGYCTPTDPTDPNDPCLGTVGDAIGEGSIAVLFASAQSAFGFRLVGGDCYTGGCGSDEVATLNFFGSNGLLINSLVLSDLGPDDYYGFKSDNSTPDIAGFSIHNYDPGGIGIDDLKFEPGDGPSVPEPSTLALLGIGLAFLAARWRSR